MEAWRQLEQLNKFFKTIFKNSYDLIQDNDDPSAAKILDLSVFLRNFVTFKYNLIAGASQFEVFHICPRVTMCGDLMRKDEVYN